MDRWRCVVGAFLWVVLIAAGALAAWPSAGDGSVAWVARESKLGQWAVLRVSGTVPAIRVEVAGWMPRPVVAVGGDAKRCVVALRREAGWIGVREIDVKETRGVVEFSPARVLPPIGGAVRVVGIDVEKSRTWAHVTPEAGAQVTGDVAGEPPPVRGGLELSDGAWRLVGTDAKVTSTLASVGSGRVFDIGGSRFETAREGADIVIRMLAGDGAAGSGIETARLRDVPIDCAIVTLGGGEEVGGGGGSEGGGQFVALWEHTDGSLWYACVSPLGVEGGRGPVSRSGPLPGREAVTLVLGLFSLFASVAVWVLVPVKWRQPISPPLGFAYAERSRRAAATVADLLPGFMLGEAVGRALSWMPADVLGVWPFVLALIVTMFHCAVCEAIFGVTLGKWAMRCRTVMPDGGKMGWKRAMLRNVVKYACPPLGVLQLMVPPWKWTNPAGLGTVVVVEEGE